MIQFFFAGALIYCFFVQTAGVSAEELHIEQNRQRWHSMSPAEKTRIIEIYMEWKSHPVEKRQKIKRNYETYHQLSPAEQARIRDMFKTYRKLDPTAKESIQEKLRPFDSPSAGQDEEALKRYQRIHEKNARERMQIIEQSLFWKSLSKEEKEMFRSLIVPE